MPQGLLRAQPEDPVEHERAEGSAHERELQQRDGGAAVGETQNPQLFKTSLQGTAFTICRRTGEKNGRGGEKAKKRRKSRKKQKTLAKEALFR